MCVREKWVDFRTKFVVNWWVHWHRKSYGCPQRRLTNVIVSLFDNRLPLCSSVQMLSALSIIKVKVNVLQKSDDVKITNWRESFVSWDDAPETWTGHSGNGWIETRKPAIGLSLVQSDLSRDQCPLKATPFPSTLQIVLKERTRSQRPTLLLCMWCVAPTLEYPAAKNSWLGNMGRELNSFVFRRRYPLAKYPDPKSHCWFNRLQCV